MEKVFGLRFNACVSGARAHDPSDAVSDKRLFRVVGEWLELTEHILLPARDFGSHCRLHLRSIVTVFDDFPVAQ